MLQGHFNLKAVYVKKMTSWIPIVTSNFLEKDYEEMTHKSRTETSIYFIFLLLVFQFSLLTS
jgi:hypothetical protein